MLSAAARAGASGSACAAAAAAERPEVHPSRVGARPPAPAAAAAGRAHGQRSGRSWAAPERPVPPPQPLQRAATDTPPPQSGSAPSWWPPPPEDRRAPKAASGMEVWRTALEEHPSPAEGLGLPEWGSEGLLSWGSAEPPPRPPRRRAISMDTWGGNRRRPAAGPATAVPPPPDSADAVRTRAAPRWPESPQHHSAAERSEWDWLPGHLGGPPPAADFKRTTNFRSLAVELATRATVYPTYCALDEPAPGLHSNVVSAVRGMAAGDLGQDVQRLQQLSAKVAAELTEPDSAALTDGRLAALLGILAAVAEPGHLDSRTRPESAAMSRIPELLATRWSSVPLLGVAAAATCGGFSYRDYGELLQRAGEECLSRWAQGRIRSRGDWDAVVLLLVALTRAEYAFPELAGAGTRLWGRRSPSGSLPCAPCSWPPPCAPTPGPACTARSSTEPVQTREAMRSATPGRWVRRPRTGPSPRL
eukprot:TRINITY_DN25732_c0_g1_i1.p1 TRINITY_DN25732_c0_g1~~TRINITY_DN25732_c0_g1_i1.p1  ORF type:complete len:475 (+),score=51.96 TRINITY_DN25732_c0_g1_i1:76-1500(+)